LIDNLRDYAKRFIDVEERLSKSHPLKRPVLLGLLVFVIAFAFSVGVAFKLAHSRQQLQRSDALAVAAEHAQALQQNLQQALSATRALATWVRLGNGDIARFDELASDMLALYPGVSALALEPGGVIRRIAPLDENAGAVGLDLLNHPEREKEARLARDSGKLTLAGPFDLVQGGLGALGFFPVFLDDARGQKIFWGFTNVVLRLPDALGAAQFASLRQQGYDYALWRIDPATSNRQIIAQAGNKLSLPVDFVLDVPNAQWSLSVAPTAGWGSSGHWFEDLLLGLLLSAAFGWLTCKALASKQRAGALALDLDARTQELAGASRLLADILHTLPDLLFELDLQGRYLAVYASRQELLAAPPEQLVGRTIHDVLPPAAVTVCLAALQEANTNGHSLGKEIELALPQGSCWFELSVSRKENAATHSPSFIVLSRDVTQRKLAEQKVVRLTKMYAALSQCNQAIVHCREEGELFAIICRDAVNFGGMKLAWIGKPDATAQVVLPVAKFGDGVDYLHNIGVTLDPADPRSHGPGGVALREGHPVWCQDFQSDPATAPWHDRAKQFGWAAVASLPLKQNGQVVGIFSVYSDIVAAFDEPVQALLIEMAMDISYALDRMAADRESQQVQQRLQESEERYRQAFLTSPDSVNINRLDDGLYLDTNRGFERLTGWAHDETVGKTSAQINIWRDMADRRRLVDALREDGHCSNLVADFVRKDGSVVHGLMSAAVVHLDGVQCVLSITRDVTEMRRAEARIERLAHFDQLTGLPNRSLMREHFELMRNLAQRSNERLAMMFLDLDHFKSVNDTLGHSVGDQLLMEVSRRLTATLRAEDSLSRMGGDEFILLCPSVDTEGAARVAGKILRALDAPCLIDRMELVSSVSIGIAMYPEDGQDFETLSKNADTAMYRVKRANRNNYCFFTQEMQTQSERTHNLVNAMRHAIERHEFEVYYQPQILLQDKTVVGAEALMRWRNVEFGSLSPLEFIPIAEDSGQILEIGEWVLRTAVAQAKQWQDKGFAPLTVAVNLSAVQFRHPNLFDLVMRILDEAGLPAEYLEIELTEATAMDNPVAAVALMNRLHERGVRMSIDDFGTGYSSLSYLKKFNVSKLKIDQSFVRDIGDDPDDKAIVSAIINLASSLGMHTIAEGVETVTQLAYLRQQGCEQVQGYYFSVPLPADQFETFLREWPAA